MDVRYADVTGLQPPPRISTYSTGRFQSSKCERSKVKVKARLNLHGIFSVVSAQLIEEEEIDVPVAKETTKLDLDKAPADGEATKKKVKKSKLPIYETVYGGMNPAAAQRATEKESEMALQDRTMEEIKEKKIALESYVHAIKKKLNSSCLEFATDADKVALSAKVEEIENWLQREWLFGDDTDETKRACIDKLEELKKMSDPQNLKTRPREGRRKFLPNKSKAILDSERESGYKNLKLFLHGQGECSSSNPSICKEDPPSEKVDLYQSQELLVSEVIAYKRNAGKYPTADRRLRLPIDEYSKIHRRVTEGKTVELFQTQFSIYKMVLHFLEDGIILDPSSDSEE